MPLSAYLSLCFSRFPSLSLSRAFFLPFSFRPGCARLFHRQAVVLLSPNTGLPLFIREKGRISLSGRN